MAKKRKKKKKKAAKRHVAKGRRKSPIAHVVGTVKKTFKKIDREIAKAIHH